MRGQRAFGTALATVAVAALLAGAAEANAADILVDTTSDAADFMGAHQVGDLPGPDGRVSLREGITAANNTAGPQVIGFSIPSSDPGCAGGVCTIRPIFGLPFLTDDGTTIDGATQTSFAGNPNPLGPEIELDGSLAGGCCKAAIHLVSSGNRVHHLAINGWVGLAEVEIEGSQNVVTGLYIGLDPTGTTAVPTQAHGIAVRKGMGNRIGGPTPRERNVISGHPGQGIELNADENLVVGNFIGTDRTGSVDLGNELEAVAILSFQSQDPSPDNNVVRGNVLSGNRGSGVFIGGGAGNTVRANLIGTDATGTSPLGNDGAGVVLSSDPWPGNAARNLIVENVVSATNNGHGVSLFGVGTDDNVAQGNLIGTDVNGRVVPGMGNAGDGMLIFTGAQRNVVDDNAIADNGLSGIGTGGGAGSSTITHNVIFRNAEWGVLIDGSANVVHRNSVRANGVAMTPDKRAGIGLTPGASSNSIIKNRLGDNLDRDCRDGSSGTGTAGTANTWLKNRGETSEPPGLCEKKPKEGQG